MQRHQPLFHFQSGNRVLANFFSGPSGQAFGRAHSVKYSDVDYVVAHLLSFDDEEDVESFEQVPDAISCGSDIIISEQVLKFITPFRVDEKVQFVEARVETQGGTIVGGDYWLPFSDGWHNAINETQSRASTYPNGMIDEIEKWIFDHGSMPDKDFWLANAERWVVSAALAKSLKRQQFSNLELVRMKVV
ncbi:MAG: hypothetical protein AAFV88_11390 [Planctomycetota bacterium]